MVAIRATDSNADPEAKESYSFAISATKDLPTLPRGTWKQFFLQLMTSSYASQINLQKVAESVSLQIKLRSAIGLKMGRLGKKGGESVGLSESPLYSGVREIELGVSGTDATALLLATGQAATAAAGVEKQLVVEVDVVDDMYVVVGLSGNMAVCCIGIGRW